MGECDCSTIGSNYAEVKIQDLESDRLINIIVHNSDFCAFLATEDDFKKGLLRGYSGFMEEMKGRPIKLSISKYISFLIKIRYGDRAKRDWIMKAIVYESPMSFQYLGVRTEQQLLDKYFQQEEGGWSSLKAEYSKTLSWDSSFIAALLDLGYLVMRGDFVPVLFIQTTKGSGLEIGKELKSNNRGIRP